jgi:hypothetical protein
VHSHPRPHARRLAYLEGALRAGRRWRTYLTLGCVAVAAVVAILAFPGLPLRQAGVGLVLGGIGALVILSMVGTNNPALDGRFAEQWSLDGLRKVRGWGVIDNLPFEREDVDHVVVAPSAVLAVERKYHPRAVAGGTVETTRHRRDLDAAERAAHKVRLFLRAEKLRDAAVVPVLIVSGPGAPQLPAGHRVEDGVHVIDGDHPELWMELFSTPRLAPAVRHDLYTRFTRYAATQATHDAQVLPNLRSELWQEFLGGIAHERATREARHERARRLRRRHGLRIVPPAAPAVAIVAPPAEASA